MLRANFSANVWDLRDDAIKENVGSFWSLFLFLCVSLLSCVFGNAHVYWHIRSWNKFAKIVYTMKFSFINADEHEKQRAKHIHNRWQKRRKKKQHEQHGDNRNESNKDSFGFRDVRATQLDRAFCLKCKAYIHNFFLFFPSNGFNVCSMIVAVVAAVLATGAYI